MMKHFVKTSVAVILSVILLLACSVTAFAGAVGNVTYDGNAQDFIFAPGSEESPTDLFVAFKDVMPGDVLTSNIVVDNTIGAKKKIVVYLRSTGATTGDEFLSKLQLKVEQVGKSTLFEAPADETTGLTNWKELGTFYAGGTTELKLTLTVPADLDSEYMGAVGKLNWQFKVDEFDIEDPKPGDNNDLLIFGTVALVALTLAVVCFVFILRRRKENEGK